MDSNIGRAFLLEAGVLVAEQRGWIVRGSESYRYSYVAGACYTERRNPRSERIKRWFDSDINVNRVVRGSE